MKKWLKTGKNGSNFFGGTNPIPHLQLGVNGGGQKASLVTTSLQLDERRLHVPGSGSRQADIASPLGSNK